MLVHIVEHRIASAQTVFRISLGVVHRGSLQHTYENGTILSGKTVGCRTKVSL